MAKIIPFQGLFYRPEHNSHQKLLAPPYDVISPEEKKILLERSPHNIVRLVLPESFAAARRDFQSWLEQPVFFQEEEPSFYWCRQEYQFNGLPRTGKGLVALLGLEELKKGSVYPHEETIPGIRQEQFQLLGEAEANFCPIIILYRDRKMTAETIAAEVESEPPFITYEDDRGVKFSLWKIRPVPELAEIFSGQKVFIADGHHRYSSAYQHFKEQGSESCGFVLTYFLNSFSDDTTVLPFHRYLAGVKEQDLALVWEQFQFFPEPDLKSLLGNLSAGWLGATVGGKFFRFAVPEKEELEVSFLQRTIINQILSRSDDDLHFDPDAQLLLDKVHREGGVAFFLPPLSPQRLHDVWEKEVILPRKSTCFYPKIPSGLVIYKHK
ncbi:MAG: DUF1015 domain-containing protein [Candidatus Omnitrophica bacterium]|nr:DUF1015 domain-containing protein [Candidatus Omnitrophota bacterium]